MNSLFSFFLASLTFLVSPSVLCETIATLSLEYAKTEEESTWGLMGRTELPENHGMLFIYPYPKHLSIWMFNCFIDLSVAFLDETGVVKEIKPLKAYPQAMDPSRPVRTLKDFALYPPNDPTVIFFQTQKVRSSFPALYALEVNAGWFEKNQVTIGDRLVWKDQTAYFIRVE